ncbi:MAG: mitochondrial matrix Mmp37 [Monoraphidium minutum]|nr:MAG: mitochondrial matrix Mmp37 [Monoraphidium minutum]
MIDFIFVADDPEGWHEENMERNRAHYSFVAALGPAAVAAAAGGIGAGVWFNTLVPLEGRVIKYGVIGRAAFLDDMATWCHLYVPGRLHKPVLPLVDLGGGGGGGGAAAGAARLAAAVAANRAAALRAALLLSPPEAELRDVVRRVAGLSYQGDVRMGLAEDSRKVERIVEGSWPGFCEAYLPLLMQGAGGGGGAGVTVEGGAALAARLEEYRRTHALAAAPSGRWVPRAARAAAAAAGGAGGAWPRVVVRQDASAEARVAQIAALPACLLQRIADRAGVRRPWAAAAALAAPLAPAGAAAAWPESELAAAAAGWRRDVARAAVKSGRHEALIHAGLRGIIRASSARQAAVGVLSAGLAKSARYLGAKLAKAWRPRPR